jgi:hypothetical protein
MSFDFVDVGIGWLDKGINVDLVAKILRIGTSSSLAICLTFAGEILVGDALRGDGFATMDAGPIINGLVSTEARWRSALSTAEVV